MANAKITELSEATFEAELGKSELPILVDFWATYCPPCRAAAPVLEEFADEFDGKLRIAKVNVEGNEALAGKYNIRSIPTFLIFKGGQIQEQIVGFSGKKVLHEKISAHLG